MCRAKHDRCKQAACELEEAEPQAVVPVRLGDASVVDQVGSRDAPGHGRVQRATGDGADGEAAGGHAGADRERELEALLRGGGAGRRGRHRQDHEGEHEGEGGLRREDAAPIVEVRVEGPGEHAGSRLGEGVRGPARRGAGPAPAEDDAQGHGRVEVPPADVAEAVDHAHQGRRGRPRRRRRLHHEVQADGEHEHEGA
eukprot:CAMPEP_0179344554 /NCGR_PEP_ID=MMETSP0797-20121207/71574_1 /TAXON_ID=47934 /ORGANISM="Dinophysis acuminata, Strain DAEP01" /LENGTH=197 /DNA_ID=CAMNT_0021058987 /DNA_START=258 /DNA_END=848 /DNA_ORIENTATION=+